MAIAEATTPAPTDSSAANHSNLCTCLCPVHTELSVDMNKLMEQTIVTTMATMSIIGVLLGLGRVVMLNVKPMMDSIREKRGSYRVAQKLPLSTTV